ncbi:MAG: 2-C-methyl-D-erythritol 2,4-cyclodiphosphate synthase [Pseudomonadota bacterium]|nr:2-C-methyl-D-erythritol 2,4-cyclodiphosphate synthase [Pseudomonadota bacterium]
MTYRIGNGYDVHRLVGGRPLILGGMEIPWRQGLAGHSDADVLLHAICDACLGAAGLGDIGRHFPPDDEAYRNIDSRRLLCRTRSLLRGQDLRVVNVDSTIVAQAPKLASHIPGMVENIAADLELSMDLVNVKATTTEQLGFCGRGEGIAAYAVVLLAASST